MSALGWHGPKHAVLELTLACNARCLHCGSDAGRPREHELSTNEWLRVVEELAELGCISVTLSGGEPLLRSDWPVVARAIREQGMRLELITNGLLVEEAAEVIAAAGFFAVTFSVDGPPAIHDGLRRVEGGFDRLLRGAKALQVRGVRLGACTQVGRQNLSQLDELFDILVEGGFAGWQLQLTMPAGRATDQRQALCLTPAAVLLLVEKIVGFQGMGCLFCIPADNLGYFGPDEPRFRSGTKRAKVFAGCRAGLDVIGLTSDGQVRGCLSLPSSFDEGSLRERSLAAIWSDPLAFGYNRQPRTLSEPCSTCAFAKRCRAGCLSLAFSATGALGHNPFCTLAEATSATR